MILLETQKEEFSRLRDIRIFGKESGEERFNGDILYLGLGGMGRKVVTALKKMLSGRIRQENNIHFMMIDSDIPEMEETIKNSMDGDGLNALEVASIYRPNLENIFETGIDGQPVQETICRWMRPDFPHLNIGTDGAKGNRQIGRLMFSNAYEDMRVICFEKLDDLHQKSASGKVDVILITGTSGGTGSGILGDVAYNIRAYAKSKHWENFRIGGCLLTPDVLFGNAEIDADVEKKQLMLANGYATLKEVSEWMRLKDLDKSYVFESNARRLSMKENIFDSCILCSGRKDSSGYVPENIICSDVAYFLSKLVQFKYVGSNDVYAEEGRSLLRDFFFRKSEKGGFKVANQSDYKIPVPEIENICEYDFFKEAYEKLHEPALEGADSEKDTQETFGEIRAFLSGQPGDDIDLPINELIRPGQFSKPNYKDIKKRRDNLRSALPRQLSVFEQNVPVVVKAIKNKINQNLLNHIENYKKQYGPFKTIDIIGAAGFGHCEQDSGMVRELVSLEQMMQNYQPTGNFERVIDSIQDICAKRFFAFPAAKKETENGYFEASIKNALEKERTMLITGMNDQDVFGDLIRQLRTIAERLEDNYIQFDADLRDSLKALDENGRRITGYLMKDAKRFEFLPADYITIDRVDQMEKGLIQMYANHEVDIEASRVFSVKEELEQIFNNAMIGLGAYGPEKLIAAAFSETELGLANLNMMFVAPSNETRTAVMNQAAKAFVESMSTKTKKKQLCQLSEDGKSMLVNKMYVSLPDAMPYFGAALKETMMQEPYNIRERRITTNSGELVMSVDEMYTGVDVDNLECAREMQMAYGVVSQLRYIGLSSGDIPLS